jgi:futalosine hydrolase
MFLVVTATAQELAPIARRLAEIPGWLPLVTGVGCLETAVVLTRFLAREHRPITAIINCGVAGAFVGAGPAILDLCLADHETQADAGVWTPDGILAFDTITVPTRFPLHGPLLDQAHTILTGHGLTPWLGPMVSVLAVSGTQARGEGLRTRFSALAENMEGAAVARVAQEFLLPCLELRAISNMVEDRDLTGWQLAPAMERLAEAMALLLPGLQAWRHA